MSTTTRPNILFLFPDQWRWDFLGCDEAGLPVSTPVIDALAARGTRVRQCRANAPVCAPMRACLSLGQRYQDCGVPTNGQDTDPQRGTIWQLLRDAGYRVATCGKNDLHKGSSTYTRHGWQSLLGRLGFTEAIEQCGKWDGVGQMKRGDPEAYSTFLRREQQLETYVADMTARRQRDPTQGIDPSATDTPEWAHTDAFCGSNATALIDGLPVDEPWCLWVNFPGPHDPFDPPANWQRMYDGVEFPGPVTPGESHNDHQQLRRNYAASCSFIDHWIGRLIDRIDQRGELDNTLIVFTSDHGDMLGDHGRWGKSTWHEGSVHVPLIVAGPGIQEGVVNDCLAELIDVGATCVDAAGIAVPEHMAARSLLPVLRGERAPEAHRDVQHMALKSWRAICDGRYKLMIDDDPDVDERERFVDLQDDPGETSEADHAQRRAALNTRLSAESPSSTTAS